METSEYLANVILAIKSDRKLRERVVQMGAPSEVLKFVELLADDRIAGEVLKQLEA